MISVTGKIPKVMKDYTIDGDYIDARMIGSLVYMVTQQQIIPLHG